MAAAAIPRNESSLQHVSKLTDVGAMARLLHECIAYQRALDLNVETSLSQRSDLDRQLSNLHQSADVLEIVKADSSYMLSNVSSTSDLADHVSAKFRHLDLAQSRVQDTLRRIDAAVQRSNCLDGVRECLIADDFESAASHIQNFLQFDSKFGDDSSTSDQREQLFSYKKQLEVIIKKRLPAAVDQRDHPTILRFIKLYRPLGIEEEGLQVYVSYLRKVVSARTKTEFEQLSELMEQPNNQSQVDFVACLTNLFQDIVSAIDDNSEILRNLCGDDGIGYAIWELQEEWNSRGSNILKKFIDYRKLAKLTSEKNSLVSVDVEGPDPKKLYLEEILLLTQLGEDYTQDMVSKIRSLTSVDPELATKAFRSGNFSKVSQDIVGYYVVLEGFFMVENVRKAIRINERVLDSLTTSMVDDVFYVLRSCCRRAISTSRINSVIAVLSGALSLLGGEFSEALQQNTREHYFGAKLLSGGIGVQETGAEITATALNNIDVSSEYALKLRDEIEEQCLEAFSAVADRERTKSCLSELNDISSSFKKALSLIMEKLAATVTLQIRPVLDSVAIISYELSEAEYADNEVNDPSVQRFLHGIEKNVVLFQPLMTANNYDKFVNLVIEFIVRRLEVIMMQKIFSQFGGLQLDREI